MSENLWGLKYAHKADAFAATSWWGREAREVIEQLPDEGTVLDFACNTGRFIEMAKMADYMGKLKYVGVDINLAGIAIAKERLPTVQFYESVAPVGYSSIDYTVIIHALPQIQDVEGTLESIWSVMKRGAGISVVIHNKWYDWLHRPLNWLKGYKGDATIQRHYSMGELKQTMWDAGFEPLEVKYFGTGRIPFLRHRIVYHGRKPG